ncbi:MAG: site-specific integrase [Pseudomonadota bacterium]
MTPVEYLAAKGGAEISSYAWSYRRCTYTTLSLVGKGDKERLAYLDPGTLTTVKNWLFNRRDFYGPLFLPLRRTGKVIYDQGRVSLLTIYDVVKKRQRQVGVESAPHDYRRSFGTELLRRGIDLPTVQRLNSCRRGPFQLSALMAVFRSWQNS